MGTVTVQPGIIELLEASGAKPRGGRHDFPDCGSHRSVTVDEAKQVFNCHHAGCDFRGGLGALRKRLGVARECLPKAEYIRQRERRDQAEDAAARLYQAVHSRRLNLLAALDELRTAERELNDAGPDDPQTWDGLEVIYRTEDEITSELDRAEKAGAGKLSLMAIKETRDTLGAIYKLTFDSTAANPSHHPSGCPHCSPETYQQAMLNGVRLALGAGEPLRRRTEANPTDEPPALLETWGARKTMTGADGTQIPFTTVEAQPPKEPEPQPEQPKPTTVFPSGLFPGEDWKRR